MLLDLAAARVPCVRYRVLVPRVVVSFILYRVPGTVYRVLATWLVLVFRKLISQTRRSGGCATTWLFVRKRRVHTSQTGYSTGTVCVPAPPGVFLPVPVYTPPPSFAFSLALARARGALCVQ